MRLEEKDRRARKEADNQSLRVLIVDDSQVARLVLRSILDTAPGIEVIGVAKNGLEAVRMTEQLRPDVITMDVRMPKMDGYEATQQIMAYHPTPILIVTASLAKQDVDFSFRMLEAGALDIFEKPAGEDPIALRSRAQALVERVRLLARVRVITHLRGRRKSKPRPLDPIQVTPAPIPNRAPPYVVAIGASTGGPRALHTILRQLPGDFAAPILVVQHIAPGFIGGLAEWLATESALRVAIARHGEGLEAGRVYIAPEDVHLELDRRTIRLRRRSNTQLTPSVDVTMHSVAENFGSQAIGVLLTGMGSDGASGLLAIQRHGGLTIAQDEASCTIFGMPRAAIEANAAQQIAPLDEIAPMLKQRVQKNAKIAVLRTD